MHNNKRRSTNDRDMKHRMTSGTRADPHLPAHHRSGPWIGMLDTRPCRTADPTSGSSGQHGRVKSVKLPKLP